MKKLTVKVAVEVGGRVTGRNSKMPGTAYPTDPFACKVGSELAKVEGSVCNKCYARRLAAYRANVQRGWARNQSCIDSQEREAWVEAVTFQIRRAADKSGVAFHRWFDAGDLASVENLVRIAEVCRRTPDVKHWLPTRERGIVRDFLKAHALPENLTIRLSDTMVDRRSKVSDRMHGAGVRSSGVHWRSDAQGHACPAESQGGSCGDCRACWSRDVDHVSYHKH